MAYSSKEIRTVLQHSYPLDSSFDAFCLDNFPEVYHRFSARMNREEKTNLLLTVMQANLNAISNSIEYIPGSGNSIFTDQRLTYRLFAILTIALVAASAFFGFPNWYSTPTSHRPSAVTPEHLAGSIYDRTGEPIKNVELILFGTSCKAITDSLGSFNFDSCPSAQTDVLIQPRVNVYIKNQAPIIEIPLSAHPRRTVIKVDSARRPPMRHLLAPDIVVPLN